MHILMVGKHWLLFQCTPPHLSAKALCFEVIPYLDARNQAELNLQKARRKGSEELSKWENLFTQTFL